MTVFSTLMPLSHENKSCMKVDESWVARVCMTAFSTLMPLSNENKSCMRVDESWWELRSESLHDSFLNSHAPVKGEQELDESWWELRNESLHDSFLNSHSPVKREQELHESWLDITAHVAKTLVNSHQLNLNQRFAVLTSYTLHDFKILSISIMFNIATNAIYFFILINLERCKY
jgi:hypothetical protein